MRHCSENPSFMVITQPKHTLWGSPWSWGMTFIKRFEVLWVLGVFPSVSWSYPGHGDFFRRLASKTTTRQNHPKPVQRKKKHTQKPMNNSQLVYIWHVLMVIGVEIKCTGVQTICLLKSGDGPNFLDQNHFGWIWPRCMIHQIHLPSP
jgi:hypothetical protein